VHDPEGEDGSGERRVEAAEAGDAEGRVGDLGGLDEDDLVELEALDGRGGDDREPGGGVEPVHLAELDAATVQLRPTDPSSASASSSAPSHAAVAVSGVAARIRSEPGTLRTERAGRTPGAISGSSRLA